MSTLAHSKDLLKDAVILFNPNSTGNGKENAVGFKKELEKAGIDTSIKHTERKGHAAEIAEQYANDHPNSIIISSSGDGGFHEVINGVLSSRNPDVVVGLLPSGNANDHYKFVHSDNVIDRIVHADIDRTDVMKVSSKDFIKYAHSYVGLGITPQIGEELNKTNLNKFKEAFLVLKNLNKTRPVKILYHNKVIKVDNLIFSSVGKMSKYLQLDEDADIRDGLFEVTLLKNKSTLSLLGHLFKAATKGNQPTKKENHDELKLLKRTDIQLDGEIYTLNAGSTMSITCEKQTLRSII